MKIDKIYLNLKRVLVVAVLVLIVSVMYIGYIGGSNEKLLDVLIYLIFAIVGTLFIFKILEITIKRLLDKSLRTSPVGLVELGKALLAFTNLLTALAIINIVYKQQEPLIYGSSIFFTFILLYYLGYKLIEKGDKDYD